jgi:hypothetical protein
VLSFCVSLVYNPVFLSAQCYISVSGYPFLIVPSFLNVYFIPYDKCDQISKE